MAAYKLRFHPKFVFDLSAAIAWYEEISNFTCTKFKSATNRQLKLIKKNPYSRSVRYDEIRFARIPKFPYAIHYSIDAESNSVLVYRLLSDSRDPAANWVRI